MPDLTHAELVQVAARWLRGTRRCALVATERTCFKSFESPDAIGWQPDGLSILVEAKVSLEDFRADHRKEHRRETIGMGVERWFLTPAGLLTGTEGMRVVRRMSRGWGLLELRGDRVRRVSGASPRIASSGEIARVEQPLLIALARRIGWASNGADRSVLKGITITDADVGEEPAHA